MEAVGGGIAALRTKVETFTCQDQAPTVLIADQKAWSYLEAVLGGDPVDRWELKAMQHAFGIQDGTPFVTFLAEFLRKPDEDGEA